MFEASAGLLQAQGVEALLLQQDPTGVNSNLPVYSGFENETRCIGHYKVVHQSDEIFLD